MFTQMGFEGALYDSSMAPQKSLNADLVLLNPQFETVYTVRSFAKDRLYQALNVEGVESVSPLYIALGVWTNPKTQLKHTILVFGIDPGTKALKFPEVNQNQSQLQMLNNVIFDQASIPEYGPIPELFKKQSTVETQLNDINVRVSALFTMGASFAASGNVITSDSTFLHIFPARSSNQVQVGLLKLKQNADRKQVADNLKLYLPSDVKVLTAEEFAEKEKSYWVNVTPIGFIFGLGVMVSFIVGVVIVYQILYSEVADYLPEYATLKAMGYKNRYFLAVLAQEALLLAIFGYIPGFIFAIGLYQLAASATMLPIFMTVTRSLTVFILTVVMCFVSGTVAMQKLKSADPSDIF
ncbi:ABC transporter permease DevC [Scytonema sp. NUACC21]